MSARLILAGAVSVLTALALAIAAGGSPPSHERGARDLETGLLIVRIVGPDARIVAEARVDAQDTVSVTVGDVGGHQVGDVLHLPVGLVPGVPRFDRRALLATLERTPGAVIRGDRIEADLGDGTTLVVEAG